VREGGVVHHTRPKMDKSITSLSQDKKDEPQKEEEEEESEDEDSEEEEEPKLKYERISGDLREILKKDGASCIAANSKLIIIGTNWGRIHVLDHLGNKVKDPVRSVALDPAYFKPRSGRRFVVGTNKVILYEKALFGQLRPTVLSENSGPARAMKWAGQFLAWATDSGVRVMDMNTKAVITLIKRDHSLALPCEQYPPHLCWPDDRTLIVGWGDSVKVCRVRDRASNPSQLSTGPVDLPPHYLEIVYMFTTDFYVCGVGPLDEHLVVLAYNKQTDLSLASLGVDSRRPQMRVLEPLQGTFEEISKDVLGIRCYQEYKPANYHLECLVEERQFYIVCPQDVVVAKPRSADDRIEWLLEHDKHAEALEVVQTSREVHRYTLLSVGRVYLDHLIACSSFQDAAKLCTQILGSDKALWEEAVVRFNRARQLRVLSPHLPLGHGINLDPAVYQMVLLDLLQTDHQGFLQVVQDWPGHLYNVSFVINAVLETLARNTNNMTLLQALAHLYSNIDKHDKALAIYLKLKHKDVFHLIGRHNLYGCVAKHVVELMSLDISSTLDICCQHVNIVPPDTVVFALSSHQYFLYRYLDALYEHRRELSKKFHSQLVTLYADLDKKKLLPFLLESSSYDLRGALDDCQARCLTVETINLLNRMGSSMQSLELILEEQHDLQWAIRLCKEHDDVDLWGRLINYALDRPEYVRELLNNIGTHIDPLLIINQIPKGMEIPGLRDALVKILHDYHLQIELRTGCQRILVSDSSNLLHKLISTQNAAFPVYGDTECAACNKRVLTSGRGDMAGLTVFACRHVYHNDCMPEDPEEQDVCLVCRNDKKRLFLML
ncbi:Vacuolar protein sorting-associated protein 41-like, partial [Homarus americanus]